MNGVMTSTGTTSGLRHPEQRNRRASLLIWETSGQFSEQGVPVVAANHETKEKDKSSILSTENDKLVFRNVQRQSNQ